MLEVVNKQQFHGYFANLFTGCDLLEHLRNNEFQATGKTRENRLNKCALKATNQIR